MGCEGLILEDAVDVRMDGGGGEMLEVGSWKVIGRWTMGREFKEVV